MVIPQWARTVLGLVVLVGIGYVVWTFKWYIIAACVLFACVKGVLAKD